MMFDLNTRARATLCGWLCAAAAAAAAPAEEPQPAQIRVITEPPGAVVYCNGVPGDVSPVTISNLAPGDYLLIARKPGFEEARRTVTLEPGQRAAVEVRLEPVCGLVLVHSTPVGANVQLNGADRGKTPLLIADLPVGPHRVLLSSPGYLPKEVELTVRDRVPVRVDIVLTSDSASLIVETDPPGAQVKLNGILGGETPCTLDRIPGGESRIELTLDGFQPVQRTLGLVAGEEHRLTEVLQPIPAELTVVSIPPQARVYVENEYRGDADITLRDLRPGVYRVRAELEGYEPSARTVTLKGADRVVEEFRLASNAGELDLTTEPADVQAFIDGREAGVTKAQATATDQVSEPLRIRLIPIGDHELQLTRKGFFPQTLPLKIERDKVLTRHVRLKRRFIPDCEVRTASRVYTGVLGEVDPAGNVRLETADGIFVTLPAADIISRRPLRDQPPSP